MANEKEDIQELENEIENQEQDYVELIQEMRNNTVAKSKYTKLEEDYKNALKALANGETIIQDQAPDTPNVEELRHELYTEEVQTMSDLEFIQKTLDLRNAVMEAGGDDPAVAKGLKHIPDASDYEKSQRIADVLQECIDYANGDSAVFVNEVQRRMVDVPRPTPAGQRRGGRR